MAAFRLGLSSSLRCISAHMLKSTSSQLVYKTSSGPSLANVSAALCSAFSSDSTPTHGSGRRDYEETYSPEEWKYVERLIPPTFVPNPTPKDEYPSGWKPQSDDVSKLPYYVSRSKNHMMPVYLRIKHRGVGRNTYIKNVKGDIWLLAKELKAYVEREAGRDVAFQVNEMAGWIRVKGDFVVYCEEWLSAKGF